MNLLRIDSKPNANQRYSQKHADSFPCLTFDRLTAMPKKAQNK